IRQPTVRNFSTGGGHLPGDVIIEGDQKIVTKKWQGYPPENLKVVGKTLPTMPEIAIPRFLGKAEYATPMVLPNMLNGKAVTNPHHDPKATWVAKHGDVEKGFAEADIVKEFTYYFAGAVSVPMQPCGSVAKWDGDKLTFWGMGQSIYPSRASLAKALGIEESKIRFIDKYNGCTFGAANAAARFDPYIAYMAKATARPVKLMLPKDQELAHIT